MIFLLKFRESIYPKASGIKTLCSDSCSEKSKPILSGVKLLSLEKVFPPPKTNVRPIAKSDYAVLPLTKRRASPLLIRFKTVSPKIPLRSVSFPYSTIPRSLIGSNYFDIHTFESRRRLRGVRVIFQILSGIMGVDGSQFYTILPSVTGGDP